MTVTTKAPTYTKDQVQAIKARGTDILVSASAGSGKTRVLVERIIEKIKEGQEIDRILVVTFGRAAAAEMKERIEKSLKDLVNASTGEDRRHYVRQLQKLPQAQISTIHSFAQSIIERFHYLTDVDVNSRLLVDDLEQNLMRGEVFEDLLEDYMDRQDDQFFELLEAFSSDKETEGFRDLIKDLYFAAIAHPNPKEFLASFSQLYAVDEDNFKDSTLYVDLLEPQLQNLLSYGQDLLRDARQMALDYGSPSAAEILEEDAVIFSQVQDLLEAENFEPIYELVRDHSFNKWPTSKIKKEIGEDEAAALKALASDGLKKQAKDIYNDLKNKYFAFSHEIQIQMLQAMGPLVDQMAQFTGEFLDRYQAYKQERQVMDFNDLEHRALEILMAQVEGEAPASSYYRSWFEEVLIDEYQDTSALQENILSLVARDDQEAGNRFMVGDVKQSIYRFRQAEPQLFISKFQNYQKEETSGRLITLLENFRSRKEVLDFTNFLFMQLMDPEVGEIAYDGSQKLEKGEIFPVDFPESEAFHPEILIYENEAGDLVDTPLEALIRDRIDGEILLTGLKIKNLVESSYEIWDKEDRTMRPMTYSDVAILVRNKSDNLAIEKIFEQVGVPVHLTQTESYYQTTEVSIMLSVLRLIDNPRQDIPLAAVLRSAIVGLDENELAQIRIANKGADYYQAVQSYLEKNAQEEGALYEKLVRFMDLLDKWRDLAGKVSIAELIWTLYQDTGYLDYATAMPNGKQRQANLHALYERAQAFEETQFKGLYAFINYIERMMETENDLAEPSTLLDGEEAVQVMTMHKSKGLEFPVVFLLALDKGISQQDYKKNAIIDRTYGVGVKAIDTDNRVRYPSLAHTALQEETIRKTYSEELRILYVALTRAEQKLFLVGSYKDQDAALKKWAEVARQEDLVLPEAYRLSSSRAMLDWVGGAIIRHRNLEALTGEAGPVSEVYRHETDFKLDFYSNDFLLQAFQGAQGDQEATWFDDLVQEETPDLVPQINDALDRMREDYGHRPATVTTSYQSVSEIKRVFENVNFSDDILVEVDESKARETRRYVVDEWERPAFISDSYQPDPAEIGKGTHLVLQTLDMGQKPTLQDLEAHVAQLVDQGHLQAELAQDIELDKILAFFETPLAEEMIAHEDSLERELAFSLKLPGQILYSGLSKDDQILVHGIVDGIYYLNPQEIILFDYKTDRKQSHRPNWKQETVDKYRGQINLYRLALESILDVKVQAAYLILLDTTDVVEVSPNPNLDPDVIDKDEDYN